MFVENAVQPAENTAEKLCILWGPGMPGPQLTAISLFTIQSVGEGFIPPGHPSTGANGHGGQRAGRSTPHIKPVRRAGCPHPAETCRHIPFPHRRPVGAGHARPAAYRQIPFTINPQGRDLSLPGTLPPPQTARAARGLAALHLHVKPVRRAGCPHPAETCRLLHAPSVHFPKFIHFFVKKSTQKIFFVL